jgi:hypothetical protein
LYTKKAEFRNMHHIHRKKIILLLLISISISCFSQQRVIELNREEREWKPYYFGMTLAYAKTWLHPSKDSMFLGSDSVMVAQPGSSPSFALGLMATAKLSNRFEVRFNPQLILGVSRSFDYTLGSRQLFEDSVIKKNIQSTIVSFPINFKFNSDRIGNFKVYMFGGAKADLDLASNAGARNAESLVKLKKTDLGIEYGIGFNLFFKFVTVSPEIKFSNGITNLHSRDAGLKFSNILDRLNSRMITFSIHLEE